MEYEPLIIKSLFHFFILFHCDLHALLLDMILRGDLSAHAILADELLLLKFNGTELKKFEVCHRTFFLRVVAQNEEETVCGDVERS